MLLGSEAGVVAPSFLDGHSFDGGVGGESTHITAEAEVVCGLEEGRGVGGNRSILRDVHVLGGVVVPVGFLSFFQTFHLPPFLVTEFDLEEPVEVAVGVLEGWVRGVRGVEQGEVELLLFG